MEDRELVYRILNRGDSQCYSEIVSRYSGMIFSKIIAMTHDADMAKEITQQAFIRAYTRLDCWQGKSLGSWLLAIAVHTALNALDKEKRRRTVSLEDNRQEHLSDSVSEHDGSGSQSGDHEQLLMAMETAISGLPPDERNIIEMFYYRQMKTADIAKALGMTESNVLVKLHRIRDKLKKQLKPFKDEENN